MRMYRSRAMCALSESVEHVRSMRNDMNTDYGNRFENTCNLLLKTLYTVCLPAVFCDAFFSAEFSQKDRKWHWNPFPEQKYPTV